MGNEFELSTCTTEDLVDELASRFRSCIVIAVQDRTDAQDALLFRVSGSPVEVFGLAELAQEKTRNRLMEVSGE